MSKFRNLFYDDDDDVYSELPNTKNSNDKGDGQRILIARQQGGEGCVIK